MKTDIDITPKTRSIRSWKLDTHIKLDAVIKELVDNSFDAFASRVDINFDGTSITISDNGRGIQNISDALSLGESESDHKRLGRHGIALKKGPARLARRLKINTQNAKALITAQIDWYKLECSGKWKIESNIWPARTKETFTIIDIYDLYKYRISGWKDLPAKLSTTFAPGLRGGKQIFLDGVLLKAPPEPMLEEVIEDAGLAGGRRFRVRAGLHLQEHTGSSLGISVSYLHRVIREEWIPKFLMRASLRRFTASVTLIDDYDDNRWELNNFKDDIEEEQQAELEAALEPILKPLVERLNEEVFNLRIRTLEMEIAQIITASDGKDEYLEKIKEGEILKPKHGRRRKHRRQKFAEQLGQRITDDREKKTILGHRSFAIKFEKLEPIREVIYPVSEGSVISLTINLAHKYGNALFEQFNRNDMGQLKATILWAVGSFMPSLPNYQKRFPYLLNGTEDAFKVTNTNVSRWLQHETDVVTIERTKAA